MYRGLMVLTVLAAAACAAAQVPNSVPATRAGVTGARTAVASSRTPARASSAPVLAVLNKRIESIDWDEQPLESVIEWLQEQGPINVVVLWRALEAQGIDASTPVTLRMRNATVGQILNEALEQLGEDTTDIRYRAQGSTVKISTRVEFNKKLYTRVYDVSDMIFQVPDFKGPEISITGGEGGGSGGGGGFSGGGGGFGGGGMGGGGFGGGGFGGGGFGGGGMGGMGMGGMGMGGMGGQGTQNPFEGGESEDDEEDDKPLEERMDDIVELIKATIAPDDWKDNGGQNTIHHYNRHIVVRAPIEVHELIGGPFVVDE